MNPLSKKTLAISLTLIGLSAMALSAAANPCCGGGGAAERMQAKMGLPGTHMPLALNLTLEQREKLRANRLEIEKQNIQIKADMKIMQMDLQAEAMKENPDMAKVENLTQKLGEQHNKMMLAHIRNAVFFRSVLTLEQKKKLDQMRMECGNGMCEGYGWMDMKGMHGMHGQESMDENCGCR